MQQRTVEALAELTPCNARPLPVEGAHCDDAYGNDICCEMTEYQAEEDKVGRLRGMHVIEDDAAALQPPVSR